MDYEVNVSLFAFPLGLAVGLAVTALLVVIERKWGNRHAVATLRSPRVSCWLLALTAMFMVAGGSLPQLAHFSTSLPFVVLLVALEVHLTLVILHRLQSFSPRRDWTFFMVHVGLWLALFSGLAGAGDTKTSRIIVPRHGVDLSPANYSATIVKDGDTIRLAVNSPHRASLAEDLYLIDYDTDIITGEVNCCIILSVVQPWKYPMLTGIVMLICGSLAMILKKGKEATS